MNKDKTPQTARIQPRQKQKTPSAREQEEQTASVSFWHYISANKFNRNLLLSGLAINLVLFALYKYCYPFPDFFSDSHSYIIAAERSLKVFYRPFGYPKFLQLLHSFTQSHLLTVAIQYFLIVLASLFCFFSIDYLLGFAHKKIKLASWALCCINPLILVVSNQMVSDPLFTALTICWFTSLLWIIKKNTWWALVLQVIVLYWSFQIRYNALYYPIIATIAFIAARKAPLYYRLAGIAASVLMITSSYSSIKNLTEKQTGASVFAGFSGWQMANNALFLYKHIEVQTEDFEDPQLQLLDKFVKHYIDSIPASELEKIKKGKLTGSVFLWANSSPLKMFLKYYGQSSRTAYLKSWYQVSGLYNQYGKQLILDHPGAYVRYYLWNNILYYFAPDMESLEKYDVNKTKITPGTQKWFNIKKENQEARIAGVQQVLMAPYPALHALLVIFMFTIPAVFLYRNKKATGKPERNAIMLVLFWYLLLAANMVFSILASIVILRYEAAWFVLGFGLPLWFLDQTIRRKKEESPATAIPNQVPKNM
jgi:hypothetical protein